MRLLWLPDVLRDAGLTVHEVAGWRTRGSDSWGPIRGITIHETRGSRTSTDAGEISVLVNGRPGLSGPIAQLYLSRTGAWHVVASGRANHNKVGWAGPNKGYGNSNLLGIEAQHAAGEPWTDRQYDSYVRGVAALVRRLGIPVSRVAGHKEHQPGEKSDPSIDMDKFRARVAALLDGEDDDMPTPAEIAAAVWSHDPATRDGKGAVRNRAWRPDAKSNPCVQPRWALETIWDHVHEIRQEQAAARLRDEAILAAVSGLDTQAVMARIDQLAAELAQRDAELRDLVERGMSGELDAAEVVRLIGERLTAATRG